MRRSTILTIAGISAASILLLAACQTPRLNIFRYGQPGTPLAVGDEVKIDFFTDEMNFNTGFALDAGAGYALGITILSAWIDRDIDTNEAGEELDERGFDNSLMPWDWAGYLRRSRDHNWFELMLHQPSCPRASLTGVSDLEFDGESGSYNFVASCDGNLALFVNDSVGFYGNNAGYANISLTRLN